MMPAQGPVTQPFGPTDLAIEPPSSVWPSCSLPTAAHFHSGIDIGVSDGTPVAATGPGTVSFAGWDGSGFGNTVRIDHGNGVSSLYGHLSDISVVVGQAVRSGDVVGASGHTGNVTGAHLHYEIDKDGCPVDPNSINPGSVGIGGTDVPKAVAAVALGLVLLAAIEG